MDEVRARVADALARGLRPAMSIRAALVSQADGPPEGPPIELTVVTEPGGAEGVIQQIEVALREIGSLETVTPRAPDRASFQHNEASPVIEARVVENTEDALARVQRTLKGLTVLFDKDALFGPRRP
ncbi:MAG TPA: hypothetical protein DEB06_11725 [Phycisphaerales bacterium]|nr:hypothetical protein [Phycisphaerales bacterium]